MDTGTSKDKDLEQIWASENLHIRRMLIGLGRDIDLADDLLQETYLRAVNGVAGYRGDNDRAWLSAIARNVFLSHIRRRYVSAEVRGYDAIDSAQHSPIGTSDHLELIRVRRAISDLDPDLRSALLMKHYCGFTYREIAERADCAVGTAKWRVSLAISRLKEVLGVTEEQMEMTCPDISNITILDYLYGALPPGKAEAVKRHLHDCAKCRNQLDDTAKVLSALDALQSEQSVLHIVELDKSGMPTLYAIIRGHNTSDQPDDGDVSFRADEDLQLDYLGAQGEEMTFARIEDDDDPNYPNTYSYRAKLPRPIAPGETCDVVAICRPSSQAATKEPDGSWAFRWGQLTSVEHEWAYVLAIRLPAGSRLVSVDPPARETMGSAGTTLMWRSVQPPNQAFQCDIRYRLNSAV